MGLVPPAWRTPPQRAVMRTRGWRLRSGSPQEQCDVSLVCWLSRHPASWLWEDESAPQGWRVPQGASGLHGRAHRARRTHTNTSCTSLPCAQGPQGSCLHTVFTLFIKIKNLPATLHRKESWWGSSPAARIDPDFQPRLPRPAAPGAAPSIATRLSTVRRTGPWGASCPRLQLLPAVGPQASL